ncbi:hypothetical protein SLEP1_g1777 [Rubroshorea leprosula]|uniref:Protein POLAR LOCALIZATION DURING ASYMMETRIC DIVISION AND REDISTRIBUTION-like n=1 Tax=Rubroshorea leprosula TaxID=152421 RepID=A0AAV5HQS5_9ROSI|nr:hypothetical protein SLEP1_g1777 [Rubroshorea leprosula]
MKIAIKPLFKSETPHHLRIADVLLLQDEEEEALILMKGDDRNRSDCALPRRILGRLLEGLRWSKRRREKEIESERGNDGSDGQDSSSSLVPAFDSPSDTAERCRRENSFNLGIGCCLLYLVAANKNELNKMMELRAQMEMILQNVKLESQRKDELTNTPETNEIFAYSTSDAAAPEGPESNTQIPPPSDHVVSDDQSLKSDVSKPEDCFGGMNQLEAELEMELERLQLRLDAEKFLGNPQEESIKVMEENTSARTSFSSSEVIDAGFDIQEDCSESQSGIPPFELERKLHELLEARQQEQIRELEAALGCVKHKLRDKETEISWWKETARLLSQHVSESSCRSFGNLH